MVASSGAAGSGAEQWAAKEGAIKLTAAQLELLRVLFAAVLAQRETALKPPYPVLTDRVQYVQGGDVVDMAKGALLRVFKESNPLEKLLPGWKDTNDKAMLKILSAEEMPLHGSTWTNAGKQVRRDPDTTVQSGAVCKSHEWALNEDRTKLLLPEAERSALASLLRLGTAQGPWDGVVPFPWNATAAPAAPTRTIDFELVQSAADTLTLAIHPWGPKFAVVMSISPNGTHVQVEVQRKLPDRMKAVRAGTFPTLLAVGPGHFVHQSGEGQIESTGSIQLPRPLARDGGHSYLTRRTTEENLAFEQVLVLADLRARSEVSEDAEHCVLYVHIHLERKEADLAATHAKRKAAFDVSPTGSPRRGALFGAAA